MKKVLAVVLTVCVVFGTAAAFAQPRNPQLQPNQNFEGREHRNQQQMNKPEISGDVRNIQHRNSRRPDGACGFEGRGPRGRNFAPDMPKEIREKAVELAKLRVDLEEAMTSDPMNKTKAIETYKKMQVLESEIDAWRFEKHLEKIEEMKKLREEKRKELTEKTEK